MKTLLLTTDVFLDRGKKLAVNLKTLVEFGAFLKNGPFFVVLLTPGESFAPFGQQGDMSASESARLINSLGEVSGLELGWDTVAGTTTALPETFREMLQEIDDAFDLIIAPVLANPMGEDIAYQFRLPGTPTQWLEALKFLGKDVLKLDRATLRGVFRQELEKIVAGSKQI